MPHVLKKRPSPCLPETYRPPGGMAYRVKDNDNWESVASKLGIDAKALIFYNFQTNNPEEVNYYLEHNVGCTHASPDGWNYSFRGAIPGIIYHPHIPPVIAFHHQTLSGMTLMQNPPGRWQLKAHFQVHIAFNPRMPDASPFCYRQYLKGRVRIRRKSVIWLDTPSEFKIPGTYGGTVGLPRHNYIEDGKFYAGKVLRYGYRQVPAFREGREIDMYYPPSYPQDGYHYMAGDEPGIAGSLTDLFTGLPVDISGISLELYFRGDVIEERFQVPVQVWARKYWSYKAYYEITSTHPFSFHAIGRPPG